MFYFQCRKFLLLGWNALHHQDPGSRNIERSQNILINIALYCDVVVKNMETSKK